MTIKDDAIAKENARRPSGNAAATRPGAQSVAAEAAARLDQRIAEKQNGATQVATNVKHELSEFERDIATKNAARATTLGQEVWPGAVAERPSAARTQLSELESDVAAKSRARRPGSELTEMEDDVVAKARANGGYGPATTPGARTELNQLESAVAAKSRQMAAPTSGGGRAELSQLESAVAAKTAAENLLSTPSVEYMISTEMSSDIKTHSYDYTDAKQDYDVDAKLGYTNEYYGEQPENKFGELPESAPTQTNMAHTALTTADHGMIREPDVEFGVMNHGGVEGLAVAVAVTEDEDDAFIPAAVEYDPDAKPPIYKNRRFRLYMFGALLLVVIVAVGVAIAVTQTKSDSGVGPTNAPSSSRENLGIEQQLQLVVGAQKLADTSTPYYKAMDWIINKDPLQLGPDAENLVQRYLTVLFYYSTTEFGPWLSCNPAEKGQDESCNWAQLVSVFPNVYQQVPWTRWLSGTNECEWAGVFCDEFNQTRALELFGQQMSGTLPVDIVNFPFLQSISVEWNNFYGTLPPEWGQMKHLLNLEIHYNFLTGSIPDSWWRAETLQRITAGANQLTGSIPSEVSGLTLLKGFFTFNNNLNGTFPTEIGELEFLSYTRHSNNFISGSLPTEFGNLVNLRELWLHRTQITGTLPTELGQLDQLQDFRGYYTGLEGSLPDAFYNMTFLSRVELYNCNMTGTISSMIENLQLLNVFHIRDNEFTGTVPTQIGNLTQLQDVWLEGNKFHGSIPKSLCKLHPAVLEADCSNTDGVQAPQIYCPATCCTSCCDHGSGICLTTSQ